MANQTDDDRTTTVGLFHYAVSYRESASALNSAKVKVGHRAAPVRFLYYHSIELYMKSFLLLRGESLGRLILIGHGVKRLAKLCRKHGLPFEDEDLAVISLLAEGDTFFRPRYIKTGSHVEVTVEALEKTARSLNESVRSALKSAGQPVR